MARKQHAPSDAPAEVDAIAALHDAIIQASEQNWEWNNVSAEERARLRPNIARQAKATADQLRAEHAARSGGKP